MANQRLSTEKRAMIIRALCEGTPIRAVCRVFSVGQNAVKRVIVETGEAMSAYTDKAFRDVPVKRLALDEAWQYCGIHGSRLQEGENDETRGDFWLWAGIDCDTKLVLSHAIGKRSVDTGYKFVADCAKRIAGHVQIVSDNLRCYPISVQAAFSGRPYAYVIETKVFAQNFDPEKYPSRRTQGIPKTALSTRRRIAGIPNMKTASTSAIERLFLSVRQETVRFTRLTIAYSKDLEMHRASVALYFAVYNLVRKHISLDGQTPAQAAGIEENRWTMDDIVAETDRYMVAKQDAAFLAAFEAAGV